MAKVTSLKAQALEVTRRVQERFKQELAASEDGEYSLDIVEIRLREWIERVSNIQFEEIDAKMLAGEWIEIDGERYLPSSLRIVKEYHNRAAAGPLVHEYDRERTHIPYDKLFQPSLFPKLDYEDVRTRALVLGEANRVYVMSATEDHYLQYATIKRVNYEAQMTAYQQFLSEEAQRKRLWRSHTECRTTDELMHKLGVWVL